MKRSLIVVLALSVLAALYVAKSMGLSDRYELSLDGQSYERCLPFWVYFFDFENDKPLERGDLVKIISSKDRGAHIKKGKSLAKLIGGLEGDRILIKNDKLYINDSYFSDLFLIKTLNQKNGYFDTEFVVKKDEAFVVGTLPGSYDSRYWGTVNISEIKGLGRALF